MIKYVWIVLAAEDGSFISVCASKEDAEERAACYEAEYGDPCEVYEEAIENGQGLPSRRG